MCIPFSHDTLSLVDVQAFENIMAFILDPATLHVEIVGLIFLSRHGLATAPINVHVAQLWNMVHRVDVLMRAPFLSSSSCLLQQRPGALCCDWA